MKMHEFHIQICSPRCKFRVLEHSQKRITPDDVQAHGLKILCLFCFSSLAPTMLNTLLTPFTSRTHQKISQLIVLISSEIPLLALLLFWFRQHRESSHFKCRLWQSFTCVVEFVWFTEIWRSGLIRGTISLIQVKLLLQMEVVLEKGERSIPQSRKQSDLNAP